MEAKGLTKSILADRVQCSRPTLNKFFDKLPINKEIFQSICSTLELDFAEIVDFSVDTVIEYNTIIEDVRQKISGDIENRCGTVRVLAMNIPIELEAIYTNVYILQQPVGGSPNLHQESLQPTDLLDEHHKLVLLGKPGSGKTTFLKQLAILCNKGIYKGNCVPVFVTLRQWAENADCPDLLTYIARQWNSCGIQDAEAVSNIASQGRALVLLDGLDEVGSDNHRRIFNRHLQS
ncbi:MAG: NACHT domain-containing protein [Leptolyngbya sp. SIO4C1]|nr:NACHT domain-containing protein [Leptolyngbya sp. SIO4C1]